MRALALTLALASCTQAPSPPPAAQTRLNLEALPEGRVEEALAEYRRAPSAATAEQRARAMVTLIVVDPERALREAMSPSARARLPEDQQPFVERWLDGVGDVDVIAGTPEEADALLEVHRFLVLGGESWRAYTAGQRFMHRSRRAVRVHGVALDGLVALSDRPLRLLFPDEAADERLPYRAAGPCPVSRREVPPDAAQAHAGDAVYQFCMPDHVAAMDDELAGEEDQGSADLASPWSTGPKTVLVMRVDFSDLTGEPLSAAAAQTLIDTTSSQFFNVNSYGQTSMTGTVTPLLRLPQTSAFYKMNENYYGLRSDAIAAATDAGYPLNGYSLDIVAFKGIYSGWAGRGAVGGRGNWLNGNFSARVTNHELGHNYGVWHANYWAAQNNSIIGAGSNNEYGNPFDVMGNGSSHFNAWFKKIFDWVPPTEIQTVTASGTYRIQALENPITTGLHALKVPRGDGQKEYWVELRQGLTSNRSLMSGVSINWGYLNNTGSHLLDMTPGSPGGVQDSSLTFGRTFSDLNRGIHITPLQKGGTTPESIDVVVNLGQFPGNQPPTAMPIVASTTTPAVNAMVSFSISASDPDGDPLAYAWDFADDTYVPSSSTATKQFANARTYFVRCTVSDMKGGTVTRSVLVTVGAPARLTLEGAVTAGGTPVEGVRVGDSSRAAYTDSAGRWVLSDVPDASVTLAAAKTNYTFTPAFTNPVVVTGNLTGLNFTGTAVTGYSVSGTVVSTGTTGLAGVTVSDGTRTAVTAANGTFTLSGVPNGTYTLTAVKPGWQFASKAVEVLGANVTGVQFNPSGAGLSGQIFGANAAATVTDGVRTVTATGGMPSWFYNLNGVPSGTYNVVATLPGFTLTPTFTNPVTVTGTFVGSLNFNAVAGASYNVSGTVTTGTVPLPGVQVSDGTRTSRTDSLGRFVLLNVPAGMHTLTPTHPSYTFMPATRAVNVTSASVTGQDFTTTVVNPPPTVAMAASATPNPVTTGMTAVLSVLGADNSGEAALKYTWSTSYFQPPSYSANGTNAAKTTTVTFTRAGTYPFEVLIEDPGGLSVRSQVTVTVQQTLVSMTVNPASANVGTGAMQQFTAQGRDQFNQFMFAGPYAWSVSGGGTISASGLFAAGTTPGGPHTVTVTGLGAMTGTALVTVTSASGPVITSPARATPNPVAGTTTQLAVGATDDGGEAALTYTWSMTAGPAPVTFSVNGTNASKLSTATFTKAGLYQLVVAVVDGSGNMANGVVDLEVEQTPQRIVVSPAAATVAPGATLQLTAEVEDQFGDVLAMTPQVTWSVSGGGVINATGALTAGSTPGGPFTVTVTTAGLTGTATFTVSSAPDVTAPGVSITAPLADARPMGAFSVVVMASDDVGVAAVGLTLDGTALVEKSAPPFTWPLDTATLANGAHVLVARARDAAGNATDSAPVRFFVGSTMNDTPPTVTLTGLTDGSMLTGVLELSVTGTDDVAVTKLELLVDGAVTGLSNTSTWRVSLDPERLAVGPHTVQARATDSAGQTALSARIGFTVERDEPEPGPMMPSPGQVRGTCGCSSGGLAPLAALAVGLLRRRRRGG
ncbi:MAG: carboxypeptidase regulatory-like domain-containing protein [Myxococcaceae bacterium]|nr:carboxypeptidase regulatory-like domain-containing protein [Myxococcaceae bacterium]